MGARGGPALLALPAIALVLLAAHFVHAGLWPVAILCIALLSLLAVRRRWAARVLQFTLLVGALEWMLTAAALAHMRAAHGQPYLRMLLILGAVTALTVLAVLVFQQAALQRRFLLAPAADKAPPPSG